MYQIINFSQQLREEGSNSLRLSDDEIQKLNCLLSKSNNAAEWMVWSTPIRTEIIVLADFQHVEGIYSDLARAKGFSIEKIKRLLTVRDEANGSLEYLAVTSLSLKSAVFNRNQERESIGRAYKFACAEGTVGEILRRMVTTLFALKKEVYGGVHIEAIRKSIAQSGINLVGDYLSIFSSPKVAIVGFDGIGKNLAMRLIQRGISQLTVFDRNPKRVHSFFANRQIAYVHHEVESVGSKLGNFDLIFSAISQSKYIISKSTIYLQKNVSFLLLVDLSSPKSIDPHLNEKLGVIRMGLEDIQKETQLDNALDQGHFTSVKKVIDIHLKEFLNWKKEHFYLDIINELKSHLLNVKRREIDKISKGREPNASPKIERLMDMEIQRLVSQSLVTLRSAKNECQRQAYLGLISQMFLS